jgi:hypothetical protein
VEATIENNPYSESAVPRWIQTISENVTQDLIALNKPFKYVGDSQPPRLELAILTVCCCCVCFPVNCIVMEQCGAGINTANSAYWDSVHDGSLLRFFLVSESWLVRGQDRAMANRSFQEPDSHQHHIRLWDRNVSMLCERALLS